MDKCKVQTSWKSCTVCIDCPLSLKTFPGYGSQQKNASLDNHDDSDRRRSPDIVRRHCCPSQSRSHQPTCSCSIHFPAGQTDRLYVQRQRKRRGRRSNGQRTNGKTFERLICFGGATVISLDLEMLTMVRKFCDFVQSKEAQ